MIASLLAQVPDFTAPTVDYHALAPEIVLAAGICIVLLVDLFVEERQRWITSTISGFVLLGAFVPVVTLAVIGDDTRNGLGGEGLSGRYVIDEYALILKALFLIAGYVVVLMSSDEIEQRVRKAYDLSPKGIIDHLDLLNVRYLPTARNGHFGHAAFPWETTKESDRLK